MHVSIAIGAAYIFQMEYTYLISSLSSDVYFLSVWHGVDIVHIDAARG